jgi:glutamine cyclotransferase
VENIKMTSIKKIISCSVIVLTIASCSSCDPELKKDPDIKVVVDEKPAIPTLEYTIVSTLPHDTTAYTEGLLIHDNKLFESTGSPDHMPEIKSVLGIVDMKTGKLDAKIELDKKVYPFGEGMVILNGKIYQVTYKEQTGFIYDLKTYKKISQFNYANAEGWGLTTDGTHVIMSDGSNKLTYFDQDMKPLKTLEITENGYASEGLNELEYIKGFIYANVWMTGFVVKIDPKTGNVVAKINFTPINYDIREGQPNRQEMNGIAYDSIGDKIYITGKLWPKIYEVKFPH